MIYHAEAFAVALTMSSMLNARRGFPRCNARGNRVFPEDPGPRLRGGLFGFGGDFSAWFVDICHHHRVGLLSGGSPFSARQRSGRQGPAGNGWD